MRTQVLGEPEMSVVAFASTRKDLNVYVLNDRLTRRGWHLNALQRPAALHFCFTAMNTGVVDALLGDIREEVAGMQAEAAAKAEARKQGRAQTQAQDAPGSAPLYGMANVSPDRGLLGEFLVAYQDTMLAP